MRRVYTTTNPILIQLATHETNSNAEAKSARCGANTHQLDVVDHSIDAVGLTHQSRHVQPAQAEQRCVEENLRQLPRPQLSAVAGAAPVVDRPVRCMLPVRADVVIDRVFSFPFLHRIVGRRRNRREYKSRRDKGKMQRNNTYDRRSGDATSDDILSFRREELRRRSGQSAGVFFSARTPCLPR